MFNKNQKPIDEEIKVLNYKGIFKKELTVFQAIALVVCGTVGAGALSIPYAISKVGLKIGILYIIVLGLLMMGLNLLLGYVTVKTKQDMQMVGLARKYLGKKGEIVMATISYLLFFGVLVVYIIGAGDVLTALLGGKLIIWSSVFFIFASFFVIKGLRSVKTIEFLVSIAIIVVILLIAYFSLPHISSVNLKYLSLSNILLPYGVILFSLHGTSSVPEAHALLRDRDSDFKKVIIFSSLITMFIYLVFTFVVIGVTGTSTTEIATIGLGNHVGELMYLFGNIFALLAMTSSFIMIGLSLKDSLIWDYKMKSYMANIITLCVPFIIFIFGLREFAEAIDLVGGVFISLEMFMILLIYWKAANDGHVAGGKYKLHHTLFLVMALIIVLIIGTVYSVLKMF